MIAKILRQIKNRPPKVTSIQILRLSKKFLLPLIRSNSSLWSPPLWILVHKNTCDLMWWSKLEIMLHYKIYDSCVMKINPHLSCMLNHGLWWQLVLIIDLMTIILSSLSYDIYFSIIVRYTNALWTIKGPQIKKLFCAL